MSAGVDRSAICLWMRAKYLEIALNDAVRKEIGEAEDGGADRDRTCDLLIANETLYQLSYDPIPLSGGLGGRTGPVWQARKWNSEAIEGRRFCWGGG